MGPIDPCYFAANDSGFDWNSYEISATPAACQERLAYKFAFQKWKPFFLCGCLCLTALTYATGNLAVAMLFTLAYGATAVSNGHCACDVTDYSRQHLSVHKTQSMRPQEARQASQGSGAYR